MYIHLQPVPWPVTHIGYGYPDEMVDGFIRRADYQLVFTFAEMQQRQAYLGAMLRVDGRRVDAHVMADIASAIRREHRPVDLVFAERNKHRQEYIVDEILTRAARLGR